MLLIPLKSLFAASLKAAASAVSSADGVVAAVTVIAATVAAAAASAPPLRDSSIAAVVPDEASEDAGETVSLLSPLAVISVTRSGRKREARDGGCSLAKTTIDGCPFASLLASP